MTSPAPRRYRAATGPRRERKRTIRFHPEEEAVITGAASQQGRSFAAFVTETALRAAREQAQSPAVLRGCPR